MTGARTGLSPVVGEPTFADAILDRIVHNAYRLELDGPSISNRFGITSVTTTSAPDLFEAGLNEAACCWPGPMGVRGERGGPTIYSARVASEA